MSIYLSKTELSWVFLYDTLTEEGRAASHIRAIDTIFFDHLNSMRPLFWLYNSESGDLCKYNLRDWTTPEIIDNIMHVYQSSTSPTLIQVCHDGSRHIILNPDAGALINYNVLALQLFTCPYELEKNIFVNYRHSNGDERCYQLENHQEKALEYTNPVVFRMKATSRLILSRLKCLNSYSMRSCKILYYVDKYAHDVWLAGFAECYAEKVENTGTGINESNSHGRITSQIKLVSKTRVLDKEFISFAREKTWLKLTKGTPIIRGSRILSLNKDKRGLLKKSFNSVQDEISKTFYPQLDCSLSFLPISDGNYAEPCRGNFCKLEMIKIPRYDESVRCLVPFYLLEMALKNNYSPYINPSLRKITNSTSHKSNTAFRRFHFIKEVPVCLKCYVVYNNIESKIKRKK